MAEQDLVLRNQSLQKDVESMQATVKHLQNALDAKSMTVGILTKANRDQHGGDLEFFITEALKTKHAAILKAKDDEIGRLQGLLDAAPDRGSVSMQEVHKHLQQCLVTEREQRSMLEGEVTMLKKQIETLVEKAERKAREEAAKVAEQIAQEEARKAEIAALRHDLEAAKGRAAAAEQEAEQLRLAWQTVKLRHSSLEDLTEVDYRPITKFVSKITPIKAALEYLKDTLQIQQLHDNCGPYFEDFLQEAQQVTKERVRAGVLTKHSMLSEDGLLAIVAFTLELRTFAPQATATNEFYVNYNQVLRRRHKNAIDHLYGFTHYLVKGLHHMPPYKGTLWRGIPQEQKDAVGAVYTHGRFIRWNGFSSTSSVREVSEKTFAGPGGLLFRLEVDADTAWDIEDISAMPWEKEKVLLPNVAFVVEKTMHQLPDGMWEIHLKQAEPMFHF